jgi:hypothetical protein
VTARKEPSDAASPPPAAFTCVAASSSSLLLTWAPLPAAGPGVAYEVRFKPRGAQQWSAWEATGATTYQVSGLDSNTVYDAQVRSRAGKVPGEAVQASSTTMARGSERPDRKKAGGPRRTVPGALSCAPAGREIKVSVLPAPGVDSYDVEVAKQDNPYAWTKQQMSTSTVVTGLLGNSTYTIRAWARVGEEGDSGIWEDLGQVSCTTGFFMSSIRCTPLSTDSIMVTWPPVVPASSSSPVSYSVRHKAREDGQWGPWRTAGAQLSTVLSGLQPNTPYDIEVRADEGDLQSEPSSASCFTAWAP